jgi:hypothetical protein
VRAFVGAARQQLLTRPDGGPINHLAERYAGRASCALRLGRVALQAFLPGFLPLCSRQRLANMFVINHVMRFSLPCCQSAHSIDRT